jgi:hypothetical protein
MEQAAAGPNVFICNDCVAHGARTRLLGTATPIQIDRMELYDLMCILHRGASECLAGSGSHWVHDERRTMDLVGG